MKGTRALRRRELFSLGAMAAASLFPARALLHRARSSTTAPPHARSLFGADRLKQAFEIRLRAAEHHYSKMRPFLDSNGDEERYASRVGSFSKSLPHDDRGQVSTEAYELLLGALRSAEPEAYLRVPLAGAAYLANPQAAYSFALQGLDSQQCVLKPPPTCRSAEAAADMIELYWKALLRDVRLDQFDVDPLALAACRDLSSCTDFHGPKLAGKVVPSVLFRGLASGDLVGPYVSQLLYVRVPHGVYSIEQRFRMAMPRVNYGSEFSSVLAMQRGGAPESDPSLEAERRYIRTGRDLARYVHRDYTFQSFLNAALFLLSLGKDYLAANPYVRRACVSGAHAPRVTTESGFCTFGGPAILHVLSSVANLALQASWFHTWLLHRRLRPEEFAMRLDASVRGLLNFECHPDLSRSSVRTFSNGASLLSQAYPEGSPIHPSYPSGHAAIAGACATALKAFFRQDAPFPSPTQPTADGLSLRPADGGPLTIGGEINKLASNVSFGRNFAGIHYRSDASEGLMLGEQVAIAYLEDTRMCLTETFDGFEVSKFSGEAVLI